MDDGVVISGDQMVFIAAMINKPVLICTVTRYYTGILVGVSDTEVSLQDPSLIYETGGMDKAIKGEWTGKRDYYGDGHITVLPRACCVEYNLVAKIPKETQ